MRGSIVSEQNKHERLSRFVGIEMIPEGLCMLRVVLADDENKVILLLQKLIDWDPWATRSPEPPTTACGPWSWCARSSRTC